MCPHSKGGKLHLGLCDYKHTQWIEGSGCPVFQCQAVTERQKEELEQIQWEVTKLVRQLEHKTCKERVLREGRLLRLEKTRARGHPVPTRLLSRSWSQVLYSSAWQEDKRQLTEIETGTASYGRQEKAFSFWGQPGMTQDALRSCVVFMLKGFQDQTG